MRGSPRWLPGPAANGRAGSASTTRSSVYHAEQAHRYRVELGQVDARTRALAEQAAALLGAAGRRAFAIDGHARGRGAAGSARRRCSRSATDEGSRRSATMHSRSGRSPGSAEERGRARWSGSTPRRPAANRRARMTALAELERDRSHEQLTGRGRQRCADSRRARDRAQLRQRWTRLRGRAGVATPVVRTPPVSAHTRTPRAAAPERPEPCTGRRRPAVKRGNARPRRAVQLGPAATARLPLRMRCAHVLRAAHGRGAHANPGGERHRSGRRGSRRCSGDFDKARAALCACRVDAGRSPGSSSPRARVDARSEFPLEASRRRSDRGGAGGENGGRRSSSASAPSVVQAPLIAEFASRAGALPRGRPGR